MKELYEQMIHPGINNRYNIMKRIYKTENLNVKLTDYLRKYHKC